MSPDAEAGQLLGGWVPAKLRKKVPFLLDDMRPRFTDYLDEQRSATAVFRLAPIDLR